MGIDKIRDKKHRIELDGVRVEQLGRRLSFHSGATRRISSGRRKLIVSTEMCGHVSCGCRARMKSVRSSNKVEPLCYKSESRGFDSRGVTGIFH